MNWGSVLEPLMQGVVTAVGILISVGVVMIRKKAEEWLEARTTTEQRELIHKVAEEAFAFAETVYRQAGGEEKLRRAINYVKYELESRGIELDYQQIRATIEKAVLEYNKTKKSA